jgi:hypothetical protein
VISWDHDGAPAREEFNIAMFMDATIYLTCVLGAGPAHGGENAPRRHNAYILQRAFFDGHHRVHDIKMLSLYGPNGMTLATFGPGSGRRVDDAVFNWANWDDEIAQLSMQQLNGLIFAAYADLKFAGRWNCVRTKHRQLVADGLPITDGQQK